MVCGGEFDRRHAKSGLAWRHFQLYIASMRVTVAQAFKYT